MISLCTLMAKTAKRRLKLIPQNLSLLAVVLVLLAPSMALAGQWRQGQVLVMPKAGLAESEFDRILQRHGGARRSKFASLPIHVINVPAKAEDAVVRALRNNPHIKFAEKDMLTSLSSVVPNDPRFSSAWHHTLSVLTSLGKAAGVKEL